MTHVPVRTSVRRAKDPLPNARAPHPVVDHAQGAGGRPEGDAPPRPAADPGARVAHASLLRPAGAGGDAAGRLQVRPHVRRRHRVRGLQHRQGHPGQHLEQLQVVQLGLQRLLLLARAAQHGDPQPAAPGDRLSGADHPGLAAQRGPQRPLQARGPVGQLPPALPLLGRPGRNRQGAAVDAHRAPSPTSWLSPGWNPSAS